MADEITITIDGREVMTTSDKMVIQAANDAGVYVPFLCYHPGMEPYGACRMCVVDVEGPRGTATLAACTLPAADGMVVHTSAENPTKVRDTTLDLLLSEHPHGCLTCHRVDLCGPQDICLRHVDVTDRCVTCPKNERCELKDTTRYHAQGMNSPLTYEYRQLQVETKDPFYDRDYNLCIVCARCVRACDELRGDVALTLTERAGQTLVGTAMGESLLESGCEFCGACLDVCPVGALTETQYKWERPVRTEQSICDGCSVGCTMTYEVNQWGKVIRAIPELNSPVNHGMACFKGKFGFDHVNDKRRIKEPLVRREGTLQVATWEEALQAAADGLAQHKGGEFALIGSPRNTNEELYVAQKFARGVMGSNHVDVISNDKPGIAEGLQRVLGYFAGTASFADVASASLTMVVSANITEEQNVASVAIKQAVRGGRQKLIVIDHREVELTRYADIWLRPYPGTDPVLLGGILHAVIAGGLFDRTAIAKECDGFDELVASLAKFTPEVVANETGVPADKIQAVAQLYAGSGPAVTLFAVDGSTHGTRTTIAQAITDLAAITGNLGRTNAGVMPLFHGANDQGCWDMGMWPSALPGHVFTDDAEAIERFSKRWGMELKPYRSTGNPSMFNRVKSRDIKAMLIMGDHVHYEDGSQGDVLGALEALDFLIVTDAFMSNAAEKANVVFPATQWAEKTGTFTNIERRVQPLRQVAYNTTVNAHDDLDIVCGIATLMGAPGFIFNGPAEVLDEIASVVPEYQGISYQSLMDNFVATAKPSNENPQPTQVMYSDDVRQGMRWPASKAGVGRHGKAVLGTIAWHPREVNKNKEFPLTLAHGRVLAQPARPMNVKLVDKLNVIDRAEELVVNPADAERMQLKELARAVVVTASGERYPGVVRISEEVLPGVVSLTTLFGELAANIDASGRPDPMNHVPRLYPAPAKIEVG